MKAYYANIDFQDLLSLPFYFLLVYLILIGFSKLILLEDKQYLNIHFLGLLLFYLLIGLVDFKIKLIPYFPDTNLFTRILETGVTPDNQSIGVKVGYKLLAIPMYWVALKSIFNYFLFNVLFFQMGLILMAGAFNQFYQVKDVWVQRFFLLLVAFMPSIIIYSFTPLRESYFVLAMGLFFYGMSRKNLINIFLILGIILAAILRVQLVLYFFIVLGARYFFNLKWNKSAIVSVLVILIPIFFIGLNFLSQSILRISITPESLSLFRNVQRLNYFESGVTYPEVNWTTWFDLLLDFPGLFFQFLLAPFPVLIFIPFWSKLAYFADGLFTLFILFLGLIVWKPTKTRGLWLLFALLYIAMSCFFEFHLLGAVRHRLPATLLIMGAVSYGLSFYLPKIRWFFKF
ncbi:hypothetical protein [Algoriphagus zhangzhouensis]|uniref:Dolichyl-phosphate-mannose-protein mannosyltransferase n=1 Tax=Algoriphagus zhangzhouensis TaxID=1073327 RepID=A0A1M7ZHU6_9BACT|nr:hypothetical protein [Algoriphagus zhangzhouensis]TDY44247.1 hypothetical protein A8938_3460 [Algoriphagus zhangzhouensis]SHO64444.1 hypothetical protein SAMN04488108_3455 [Algoriphagus zhangzhouensis]